LCAKLAPRYSTRPRMINPGAVQRKHVRRAREREDRQVKAYEELAVLEEGEDGAIISIYGQSAPFVLLSASYLGHLASVMRAAESLLERLSVDHKVGPLEVLCSEIRSLLKSYDDTCLKYTGNVAAPKSMAEVERELDQLRQQLEQM
jgi:hypothetical protein